MMNIKVQQSFEKRYLSKDSDFNAPRLIHSEANSSAIASIMDGFEMTTGLVADTGFSDCAITDYADGRLRTLNLSLTKKEATPESLKSVLGSDWELLSADKGGDPGRIAMVLRPAGLERINQPCQRLLLDQMSAAPSITLVTEGRPRPNGIDTDYNYSKTQEQWLTLQPGSARLELVEVNQRSWKHGFE